MLITRIMMLIHQWVAGHVLLVDCFCVLETPSIALVVIAGFTINLQGFLDLFKRNSQPLFVKCAQTGLDGNGNWHDQDDFMELTWLCDMM